MPQAEERTSPDFPEFVMSGPFGGVQSEAPPEAIEGTGFLDSVNMMLLRGECRVRPRMNILPAQPSTVLGSVRIMDLVGKIEEQNWSPASLKASAGGIQEPWQGVADFYNIKGNRLQIAATPTRVFQWDGAAWASVGGALNGTIDTRLSFAVVAEKLCFCQGIDKVQLWDGITGGFADASADAVPARYVFELERHLIALHTIEAGERATQRMRWTAAGDPTDWAGFGAGQIDLFNDLGPINGGIKLFQYGYIFQQFGITQVIPTGVGTNPFYLQQLSSRAKGLHYPATLVAAGETKSVYVGKDNVYSFDGTQSEPIGDMQITNSRHRVGARSRIFADLMTADRNKVFAHVTSAINGTPFNAYWLTIPNVCTWVYNFDEMNWTRWTWASEPSCIGNFALQGLVRIKDLIGSISQQQWSPYTLTNDNPFDSVFIGCADATPGLFDFSGWSEMPWVVETGQLGLGDHRHEKTIKKLRLIYRDYGESTILVQLVNNNGQVWVPNYINVADGFSTSTLLGSNTGRSKIEMFMPSLAGHLFQAKIYGAPGQPFSFTELGFIFSPGGEIRAK